MKNSQIFVARALFISGVAMALAAGAQAQFSFTQKAPEHLFRAEQMALGIYEQTYYGHLGEQVNGAYVSHNRYGASWANTVIEFGTSIYSKDKPVYATYYKNNTVCGNFVTRMLGIAYNWDWTQYAIPGETTTNSPNSRQYAKLIQNGLGFTQITDIATVTKGDIMVIDYKTDPDSDVNSGHTMIVRSNNGFFTTTADAAESKVYRVWSLGIVDSTSSPHDDTYDRADSRRITLKSGATHSAKGAGVGTLFVITDTANEIQGYAWKFTTATYSKTYTNIMNNSGQTQTARPISIGRLVLPAQP